MKFIGICENHLYKKTYRSGAKKGSRNVSVYVLRDKDASLLKKRNPMKTAVNRIGISASKKVGGAVQRNRAKRVVREAYRQIDKTCGVKKGYLIVFAVHERCTVSGMREVTEDIRYCFSKLGMLESGGEKTEKKDDKGNTGGGEHT